MRRPIKLFVDLIPELRDLPDDQAQQLFWKYYIKSFRRWEIWLGLVGLAGCICLWDRIINLLPSLVSASWVSTLELFLLVIFTILGMLIYNLLVVHAINREFRKEKD